MENTFADLGITSDLIDALKKEDIKTPTTIQKKTISLILEKNDIIASSDTGTGKTLAFVLPILQNIDTTSTNLQTIILAPTYELVLQIQAQILSLIKNANLEIISQAILGTVQIKRQIDNLKKHPHILVASSGRILELMKRKKLKMHLIKTIVLDEVDRLTDKHNLTQVQAVIKATMKERQLISFSATIPNSTEKFLKEIMPNAKVIKAQGLKILNSLIVHKYTVCEWRDKIKKVRSLAHNIKDFKAIIFINISKEIEVFADKLQYHSLKGDWIHGSRRKFEREKAIRDFRNNKINILIASDLAARGLDFKNITHIINIDIPEDPKTYLHRAGRTGRAGKKGTVISLVTEYEKGFIKKYQKKLGIEVEEF